jgi:glycosyltransferase involved in cell wall biosynthesis
VAKIMLVTVITLAKDRAAYIQDSIESVLKQSYSDFKYILLDDGSIDETTAICLAFSSKDSRIKFIRLANSEGVSNARNQALSHVTTEYVCFLDSDDLWEEDFLEKQLKLNQKITDPNCIGSFCSSRYIDSSGQKLNNSYLVSDNNYDLALMLTSFSPPGNGSSLLIKTAALRNAGEFNTTFLSGGDFEMWLRVLSQNPQFYFKGNSEQLVRYRQHSQNITALYPDIRSETLAYCLDRYLPLIAENIQIKSLSNFALAEAKAGQYKSAFRFARLAREKSIWSLLNSINGIKTLVLSFGAIGEN